jgi:hypothetical protein
MSTRAPNEIVEHAWNSFQENKLDEALNAARPYKSENLLAISICILIEMSLGTTETCDQLIIEAEANGARGYWDQGQSQRIEFGLLLARLDGINMAKNNSPTSMEFVELCQYLTLGFGADLSFHKSIILTRRLWSENSQDVTRFSRPFFLLLNSESVDENTGDIFMENFLDVLNWSLSRAEAKNVIGAMATMWENESE